MRRLRVLPLLALTVLSVALIGAPASADTTLGTPSGRWVTIGKGSHAVGTSGKLKLTLF